jgi:hypothetical protein
MRKKQRHLRLIDRKYFRVYYSGAYALLEIDFGRTGHGEFVVLFGCIDKPINCVYYKRITKEVHYVV